MRVWLWGECGSGYRVSGTGCRWNKCSSFSIPFPLFLSRIYFCLAPFLSLVYPKSFSFDLPYPVLLISRLHPSLLQYL